MKTFLQSVRRRHRLLLGLLILLLLARLWLTRGQSERLFAGLDMTLAASVQDGRMYWLDDPGLQGKSAEFCSQAITGGPVQKQPLPIPPKEQVTLVHFGKQDVYLRKETRKPNVDIPVSQRSSSPQERQIIPGTNRVRIKNPSPPASPAKLLRFPRAGGASQEWADIDARSLVVVGEIAYWLDTKPDESWSLYVEEKGKPLQWIRSEVIGHSVLKATPLAGGPTRTLATGLPRGTILREGKDGVFWTVLQPGTGTQERQSLFRFRRGDTQPVIVSSWRAGRFFYGGLVEGAGRFYWKEYDSSNGISRYVTAAGDGSEPTALNLRDQGETGVSEVSRLKAHRGKLYARLTTSRSRSDGSSNTITWLCRLHPEREFTVEKLLQLPPQTESWGQFDGDYYYFQVNEEQDRFWDWSSSSRRTQRVLYRYRLPH